MAIDRTAFLTSLYAYCEGQIELRALPSKHQKFFALDDFKAIEGFCREHEGENLYFAVATRNGGGTKDHIKDIPAVWTDIDFKDLPHDEAKKKIRAFPLRPTFILESGGGYHAYWMLKEPHTKDDIEAVEALNRAIASSLQGDPAACDASRILRLPDTNNFKYKPSRPVKCIHYNPGMEYDLDDFEFLPPPAALECDPQGSTTYNKHTSSYRHVTQNPPTRLKKGRNKRNIGFSQGVRDESLFHLANHLVKGGMAQEQIEIYLKFIASKCDPPFSEKETKDKIKSAFKRTERKKVALTAEIKEWIAVTSGYFSITDAWDSRKAFVTRWDLSACRR
jgi:hypothetical protein